MNLHLIETIQNNNTYSYPCSGFENINDMLVPVIWFEESAQIPEESAQKFRSLYTDKIRLVNIVLSSLFIAALGLLAIDLRLFMAGRKQHGHRCLKFESLCKSKTSRDSGVQQAKQQLQQQHQEAHLVSYQDSLVEKLGVEPNANGLLTKKTPVSSPLLLIDNKAARRQQFETELRQKQQTNKSVEFTVAYNDTKQLSSSKHSSQLDSRLISRPTNDGRGSVVSVGQPAASDRSTTDGGKSTRMWLTNIAYQSD